MFEPVLELDPLAKKIADMLAPHIEREGFELVWLECKKSGRGGFLRVSIDRPGGGITLNELEDVSRVLDSVLDVYDPFDSSYVLEVSSPGINRPLSRLADFEVFRGRRIRVQTRVPHEGRRTFLGILSAVSPQGIEIEDEAGHRRLSFLFRDIRAANYEHDFGDRSSSRPMSNRSRKSKRV